MEKKAFDLKDLAQKLKEKGLPEVEQLAEKSYEAIKEWYVESAALSENKIDDVIVPFLGLVDNFVKPQIDKIHKEEV